MTSLFQDKRLYALLAGNIISSIGSGITMVGVPWLLVNRSGGEQIFGYAALFVTLFMLFASAYIGVFIDRFSRKKLLLFGEIIGFCFVAVFAVWGLLAGSYQTWQLIAVYFGGIVYYGFHFPAQFAFSQEIFDRSQYQSLNGVMEIQGQAASMVAGGLASLVIEKVDLSYILLLDAASYMIGFLLIVTIPYQANHAQENLQTASVWSNMKEGFLYLKEKPLLIVFFVCSLMPFIGVMVGNYLFPVYISKVLHADASVMALSDMIYAIGAILAGLSIPPLIHKFGSYRTIAATVATYAIGTLLVVWLPVVSIFLILKISLGWGNAGARVARNTIMMDLVPNHLIGRVNSFFNAVGYGLRVSLIGFFTTSIAQMGAANSLLLLGLLIASAFFGLLFSRSSILPIETENPVTFR